MRPPSLHTNTVRFTYGLFVREEIRLGLRARVGRATVQDHNGYSHYAAFALRARGKGAWVKAFDAGAGLEAPSCTLEPREQAGQHHNGQSSTRSPPARAGRASSEATNL